MEPTTLAIGLIALAAVGVVVFLVVNSTRRRRALEDVPPAMRPAYSDEQLETTVLERTMGWGVVLTLFFAVFFPIYWLLEPSRLEGASEDFFVEAAVRGEEHFTEFCSECHGSEGRGGAAPLPGGGTWPAPNLRTVAARYADNPEILDIEQFVRNTIEQGRPGTPMPAWSPAFGGSLTDQQIEDIVTWILVNQEEEVTEADAAAGRSGEELFQENCARCHGEDLGGTDTAPSLTREFERHDRETILDILRTGIVVPGRANMPPWQESYMYEGARFTDDALERIVDYIAEQQESPPEEDGESDEETEEREETDDAPEDDDDLEPVEA